MDFHVRNVEEEDFKDYRGCQIEIWESLREFIPSSFVDTEIGKLEALRRDDFLLRIFNPNRINLVAELGDSIVGLVRGRCDDSGLSFIGFVGVIPPHRRKGIAKRLLEEYIKRSRERRAVKISLNTTPSLKSAIKLYIDMGFIPEGYFRRHRYGVDLIFYSLFLD
jgi:ribosomal protein S18 acetylase RimI-like enzyme